MSRIPSAMDALTRQETLQVLRGLNIDIPENTRLLDDVLDKRLRDALNAAQYKDSLSPTLDLQALPEWPQTLPPSAAAGSSKEKPDGGPDDLFTAIQRGNLHEAQLQFEARQGDPVAASKLYLNPFTDLRGTLMDFARILDRGGRWCVFDNEEHQFVGVRVVSIRKVDARTPAFIVLYRAFKGDGTLEGVEWVTARAVANPPELDTPAGEKQMFRTRASSIEQRLLLKLLKLNAGLLPSDFAVHRYAGEEKFKASVLLPVGPLDYDAIGKLNSDMGCAVCGRPSAKRCSQCQSIAYCTPECQRSDWPNHRANCRALQGARWCAIRVSDSPLPGGAGRGMHMSGINRHNGRFAVGGGPGQRAPPNAAGERLFLVKFQAGMGGGGGAEPGQMMLYDRKRTFQFFFHRQDDRALFGEFYREMCGPRGGHGGLKMYRWAKRTGDWELSVCLDRAPTTDTKW